MVWLTCGARSKLDVVGEVVAEAMARVPAARPVSPVLDVGCPMAAANCAAICCPACPICAG